MNILAVDDERKALSSFVKVLGEVEPEARVTQFTNSDEAFRFLAEHKIDVVFLDIEMDGYSGIELAKKCESLCPRMNIIFVTGYSRYALDALKLHASGYLMKPVRAEDLRHELNHLRYPLPMQHQHKVRAQTFGNFELFVDGIPLRFTTSKCKEAIAFLIDRKGAAISYSQLASILWEDKPYDRSAQNNTHRMILNLMKTVKEAGIEDIIVKTSKNIAVCPEKFDCDYYSYINDDKTTKSIFLGEYMSNYSWAEPTLAGLCSKTNKRL